MAAKRKKKNIDRQGASQPTNQLAKEKAARQKERERDAQIRGCASIIVVIHAENCWFREAMKLLSTWKTDLSLKINQTTHRVFLEKYTKKKNQLLRSSYCAWCDCCWFSCSIVLFCVSILSMTARKCIKRTIFCFSLWSVFVTPFPRDVHYLTFKIKY